MIGQPIQDGHRGPFRVGDLVSIVLPMTGNARLSFGAFLWPIRGLKSKKRAITRPMQLRLQKPLILLTQKGHSAATDQASSVLPIGGGAATRIAATIRSTTRKG